MFSHFNHQQIRRYVLAFGSFFDRIELRRLDGTGAEVQRMVVPLEYGPKEQWYSRLVQDPNFLQGVRQILPRLSYELSGINWNAAGKLNSLNNLSFASVEQNKLARVWVPVPYTLDFTLSLFVKLQTDGYQIIEQILPYFTPDLTFAMEVVPDLGLVDQIPLVLHSVSWQDLEEGPFDKTRTIEWTLKFTMRAFFYGPVRDQRRINEVVIDLYDTKYDDLTEPPVAIVAEDGHSQILTEDGTGQFMDESTDNNYLTHGHVVRIDTVADPNQEHLPSANVIATTTTTEYDSPTEKRSRTSVDEDVNDQ